MRRSSAEVWLLALRHGVVSTLLGEAAAGLTATAVGAPSHGV